MSVIDTIFIFLYIMCGYGAFVFLGNHFGRGYAIAGFFLGYLLAWGAKRLILRIIFSKTSSRIGTQHDKQRPAKRIDSN